MWRCSQISFESRVLTNGGGDIFLLEVNLPSPRPFRMMRFPSQQLVVLADLHPWSEVMQHHDMYMGFQGLSSTLYTVAFHCWPGLQESSWIEYGQNSLEQALFSQLPCWQKCVRIKSFFSPCCNMSRELCQWGDQSRWYPESSSSPFWQASKEWTRHDQEIKLIPVSIQSFLFTNKVAPLSQKMFVYRGALLPYIPFSVRGLMRWNPSAGALSLFHSAQPHPA